MKPVNEVNIHTWRLDVDDDHIPEEAIAQADWNQNDETATDYVKNKPFYTGNPVETVLIDNLNINCDPRPYQSTKFTIPFEEGVTYKVTWDGTVYECVPYYISSVNTYFIGNGALAGFEGGNIEPFLIGVPDGFGILIFDNEETIHTISISANIGTVHTIDKKYIPSLNYLSKFNPSGHGSFSVGDITIANGDFSHAEGTQTTANGYSSHAEGLTTIANGDFSHAEGEGTTANGYCQHTQGKYNIADSNNTYAHIVGNGTSEDALSNAHTLDWSGNAWFAGTVEGTALILKSSTTGSTKRFKITVDDGGAISATEVTMKS